MVLDIQPDPRPPAMFWSYMREIHKDLDTSKMNSHPTSGHAFFRCQDPEEYEKLKAETIHNKGRLGELAMISMIDIYFYSRLSYSLIRHGSLAARFAGRSPVFHFFHLIKFIRTDED